MTNMLHTYVLFKIGTVKKDRGFEIIQIQNGQITREYSTLNEFLSSASDLSIAQHLLIKYRNGICVCSTFNLVIRHSYAFCCINNFDLRFQDMDSSWRQSQAKFQLKWRQENSCHMISHHVKWTDSFQSLKCDSYIFHETAKYTGDIIHVLWVLSKNNHFID